MSEPTGQTAPSGAQSPEIRKEATRYKIITSDHVEPFPETGEVPIGWAWIDRGQFSLKFSYGQPPTHSGRRIARVVAFMPLQEWEGDAPWDVKPEGDPDDRADTAPDV